MARLIPLLAGFTTTVGQIVLIREIIVLFNGNELSLGIALAAWLMWTAAGSGLTGSLIRKRADVRSILCVTEILCGIGLPLTICALREARALSQTVPGELLGPLRMALLCLACLSGFCALSGGLFTLAAKMLRHHDSASQSLASSSAYLLETAGSALGGIAASILLLRFFNSMQISMLVGVLCIGIGASLFVMKDRSRIIVWLATVLSAVPILMYIAPRLEMLTEERLWPGFDLLASRDSVYGRLTVIGADGMRSVYDNGSILTNVPDPAAAEESVHYALLEHFAPRRVLLIGNGMNGSIAEILKHPTIERVDYVELDPMLITMYRRLFPYETAQAFSDQRVHVHEMDGRLYLQSANSSFDVILVNVPDPASAQLNRFYTTEFFRIAREHLAPDGLLALELRSSEESISPQLAAFLQCIGHTLDTVFPQAVAIPGESLHFFASAGPAPLTEDPQVLVARLRSRNLQTMYVREYFIPYRMMPDRIRQIHELLNSQTDTPINRDFHPAAYYFSNVLWSGQFGHGYALLLEQASRIRFSWVLISVVALSIVFGSVLAVATPAQTQMRAAALWCVTASGYTLMAIQIVLLLAFQSVFGYVYHELAILIGAFMGGVAAGSWLGIKHARGTSRRSLLRATAINQVLLVASTPALLGIVYWLSEDLHGTGAVAVVHAVFPVLAALCAMPGGYLFSVSSAIYLDDRTSNRNLAALYSLDLFGGCTGALVLAGFLIPLFGFWAVAWLAAAVSLAPAALAARCFFSDRG
jgi:spermidine synthase